LYRFLGRRKTVLVSLSLVVVCGLAASFANSYWMYISLRFFIEIGVSGSMQNCFILRMSPSSFHPADHFLRLLTILFYLFLELEHADMKARALFGLVEQIPFAVGYMILPGLAYLFRSWWKLQLAFGILSLSVISNWWYVDVEKARDSIPLI
jgi:OCT family organic cation transporter-like MFS transporter 4/5